MFYSIFWIEKHVTIRFKGFCAMPPIPEIVVHPASQVELLQRSQHPQHLVVEPEVIQAVQHGMLRWCPEIVYILNPKKRIQIWHFSFVMIRFFQDWIHFLDTMNKQTTQNIYVYVYVYIYIYYIYLAHYSYLVYCMYINICSDILYGETQQ